MRAGDLIQLSPMESRPASSAALDQLTRQLEVNAFDDPAYVVERAEQLGDSLAMHRAATLAEFSSEAPVVSLGGIDGRYNSASRT
jgi:hypothetical protein